MDREQVAFALELEFFLVVDLGRCSAVPVLYLSSLGMCKIILTTWNGFLQPCTSLLSHMPCAFYLFIAIFLAWPVLSEHSRPNHILSLLTFSHTHFCTKVPEALVIY